MSHFDVFDGEGDASPLMSRFLLPSLWVGGRVLRVKGLVADVIILLTFESKLDRMVDKHKTKPLLDARSNVVVSFLATAIAEVLVYPLDTVKAWLQTQPRGGLWSTTAAGLRHGGIRGLYEGVPLAITRLSLSTTVLMTIPQALANWLQNQKISELATISMSTPVVTFTVNGLLVPFETLKTRVQADSALPRADRRYPSLASATQQFVRGHGIAALWAGTMPTVGPRQLRTRSHPCARWYHAARLARCR